MVKSKISLVAGSIETKKAFEQQLREYLDDSIELTCYSEDEGIEQVITGELIILTSEHILNSLREMDILDKESKLIVAHRTINFAFLESLLSLPDGTKVIMVNDMIETANEAIEDLKNIGITYLEYIPYSPNSIKHIPKDISIAVTPGECNKVPSCIKRVIDIGVRIMDTTTILEILYALNISHEKAKKITQNYLIKMTQIARSLAESRNKISELNEHLQVIIGSLRGGVLVYNSQGIINFFNEQLKKMININIEMPKGKHIKEVIHNIGLLEYLMNKKEDMQKKFNIDGREFTVSKLYLENDDCVLVSFKSIEELYENSILSKELVTKGYFAKYCFDDILGKSQSIKRVKNNGIKLAKTELTILIEGESGTGKELFASAIHNASNRRNGPFLAVNFSAISDNLIESELFGHEEGAFTGAKKGGRAGYFEQADGGTIFIDEIGDASPKVQLRLLRVLQEKEIMRVGGSKIKHVDVRIIAATNKDLASMVLNKEFREDLYFRLKIGYIYIPPLRERKEDIPEILDRLVSTFNLQNINIEREVIETLMKYEWYGNIREMKNMLMYMLAVGDHKRITINDVPSKSFFIKNDSRLKTDFDTLLAAKHEISSCFQEEKDQKDMILSEEYYFILNEINKHNINLITCGREKLARATIGTVYEMTANQMRNRLKKLERMKYIKILKGKGGTVITEMGRKYIECSKGKSNI